MIHATVEGETVLS